MRLLYYVKMIILFCLIRCCFMWQCRLGNNSKEKQDREGVDNKVPKMKMWVWVVTDAFSFRGLDP